MNTFKLETANKVEFTISALKNNYLLTVEDKECSFYLAVVVDYGVITIEEAVKEFIIHLTHREIFYLTSPTGSFANSDLIKSVKNQKFFKSLLSNKNYLKVAKTIISIY